MPSPTAAGMSLRQFRVAKDRLVDHLDRRLRTSSPRVPRRSPINARAARGSMVCERDILAKAPESGRRLSQRHNGLKTLVHAPTTRRARGRRMPCRTPFLAPRPCALTASERSRACPARDAETDARSNKDARLISLGQSRPSGNLPSTLPRQCLHRPAKQTNGALAERVSCAGNCAVMPPGRLKNQTARHGGARTLEEGRLVAPSRPLLRILTAGRGMGRFHPQTTRMRIRPATALFAALGQQEGTHA
jgi:hypothetical protein